MQKSPLVYLASPYTVTAGQLVTASSARPAVPSDDVVRELVEQRFAAVCRWAGALIAAGLVVYSPIAHSHAISQAAMFGTDWETWRGLDLVMLAKSDVLIVLQLDGWSDSVGVRAEVSEAHDRMMPILYWDPALASAAGVAAVVLGKSIEKE